MNWEAALGSLAAVLALAGLARWLRLGEAAPLTEELVRELVSAHGHRRLDASVTAIDIAADARSATAHVAGGSVLRIRAHGARYVVERVPE